MKKLSLFFVGFLLLISGCGAVQSPIPPDTKPTSTPPTSTVANPPVTSSKKIALTFDDGPYGTSTAQILAILKKENVHATFFVMGMRVEQYPDQAKQIVKDGHALGNHSYNHSQKLAKLSAKEFKNDLDRAEEVIEKTTGLHATLFRPPYGSLSQTMKDVLTQNGYTNYLWNIDPEDWNYASSTSAQIIERVLRRASPNAIVLMHDGRDTHNNYPRDNTVNALPVIIKKLKEQGYTFVTVDQLPR